MKQRIDQIMPFVLAAVFTIVVQGLSLMEFLPLPVALLIGAGWAVLIGLVARWVRRRPALSAWVEDGLVALGCVTMALFAFGGAIGLVMLGAALDSSSITGETMVTMFLPSIPIAIAANVPTELVILPGLLVLGWRPGTRRILFVAAAVVYFVHRVWTYLVFAPDRLDFAAAERSTAVLTAAEKDQFSAALHVDDPRWVLNLLTFAILLLSAFLSRRGQLGGPSPVVSRPSTSVTLPR
ncbi:hypothetical protein [Micromonospora sp. NPDC048898]|uniref:hypothetical protein n=1 Tax=Micromonospora sp. NPDC048898 TaxID=3364260 RepID=UPI00371719AB